MKILVLGSMLAISVLLTVPAAARGGYPAIVEPFYPYPSYCEQCFGGWLAPSQPRVVVQRRVERHRTGKNATAK
jgi:hypothetical protein